MFSEDVASPEPTSRLTWDASAWGQVPAKRAHGGRGSCIGVCVPGSRATASRSQPLHTRGPTPPGPPRAAPRLSRAGGRAPGRELGHAGGALGTSPPEASGGGLPNLWERTGRSPKHGETAVSSLRRPRAWAWDTASQRRRTRPPQGKRPAGRPRPSRPGPRAAHLPAARGARTCPPLCSSSGPSSPRDPSPPARPPAPQGSLA